MTEQSKNPYDRIIWSADVDGMDTLRRLLDQMPDLRLIKVDRLFTADYDLSAIDELNARGLKVMDDAKIVEIPSKTLAIVNKHLRHSPWMINVMSMVLSSGVLDHEDPEKIDGLARVAEACRAAGTKAAGVTVLTSKTPEMVEREFNGRSNFEQVLFYAEMLLACGFTDIICSPAELEVLRADSRFDGLDINTPAIRLAGADKHDQARTLTPEQALAAGSNRMVIGRPITFGNPADNLKGIAEAVAAALN